MTPCAAAASSPGVLTGALVGLAGVLIAAFITQVWTQLREREARRAEAQRAALYDFQDAALDLREAYADYAEALPPDATVTRKFDRATSRVDVVRERVFDDTPKLRYRDWVKCADAWYLDGEKYAAEDDAWRNFNKAVGAALKKWR